MWKFFFLKQKLRRKRLSPDRACLYMKSIFVGRLDDPPLFRMTCCFKFPQALAVHEANSCTWVCSRHSPSLGFWIVCIEGCFSGLFHFRTCPAHILSGKPEETWSKGRILGKLWKQTWQHEWTPSPSVRSRAGKRARSWHCSHFYWHLAKQEICVQRTSCELRASQPTCAKIKPFAMCPSAKQVKHSTCIGRSPAHGAERAWKWFTRNWSRRLYHCCLSDTPHLHNCKMWRPYRCSMLGANMNRMKPPEKLVEELNLKPCPAGICKVWELCWNHCLQKQQPRDEKNWHRKHLKNDAKTKARPCRQLQPRGPFSQTPLWKPCPTWWNRWFLPSKRDVVLNKRTRCLSWQQTRMTHLP